MPTTSAVEFASLARRLAVAAHQEGLSVPGFRSPPRLPGPSRTVRRYPGGASLVSVVAHDRAPRDVLDDMIEGVLLTNGLRGSDAERARVALRRRIDMPSTRAA